MLGLALSLSFDFARSPTDAKPFERIALGVAHGGVRLTPLASLQLRAIARGRTLHALQDVICDLHGSLLVSAVSRLRQVVLSQHGHRLQ